MEDNQLNKDEISSIIEGCIEQNSKCQRLLYDLFAKKMAAVCMRYVKDYNKALDLMHDGFITVYRKIHLYSNKGSFEGWMRRLFINTCLEYLRKNDLLRNSNSIEDAYDIQQNDQPSAISQMSAKEILKAVNQLPDAYRIVFNLHVIEGYSLQEIAKENNSKESTIRSQFHRARKMLQTLVRKEYND